MIDEMTKTIKAQLYERVSSPLFSSFILSWAAWNYKFFLVVVSSASTSEKFSLIDGVFPGPQATLLYGVVFPLFTALALIFLYPIPAKYIYKYSRLRQQELKVIQTQIDDATPMTKDEARKLRKEALATVADLEAQLEKRRLEAVHFKERIVSMQKELDSSMTVGGSVDAEEPVSTPSQDASSADLAAEDITEDEAPGIGTPVLSEKELELLLEACADRSGTILHARYIGGTTIQTNGKNFIRNADRETVAAWEGALKLLVEKELVLERGNKGEVFEVADLGYRVAKLFKLPVPSKSEIEFAREATARFKSALRWEVITDRQSPAFQTMLKEYLDTYVPANIALKRRHQDVVGERLHAALVELQALD